MRREYQRHLPHQIPEGVPIFLTWNLKGAMPRTVLERLERDRELLQRRPPRPGESARDRAIREGKLLFAKADRFLDGATTGPRYLGNSAAAQIVEDAFLFGVRERYELFAWCVMANHVHVLLTPRWELAKITQGIKGFTACEINRMQHLPGRTFWVDESYDHWTRDEEEFLRIIDYVENNPVKAGLCARPEDWLWSSARFRSWWPKGKALMADQLAMCTSAIPG